jgi:hypothetical protein
LRKASNSAFAKEITEKVTFLLTIQLFTQPPSAIRNEHCSRDISGDADSPL